MEKEQFEMTMKEILLWSILFSVTVLLFQINKTINPVWVLVLFLLRDGYFLYKKFIRP